MAFLQTSHDSNLSKEIILFSRDLIQKLPSFSFGSDSRRLVASDQGLQGAGGGLETSTSTGLAASGWAAGHCRRKRLRLNAQAARPGNSSRARLGGTRRELTAQETSGRWLQRRKTERSRARARDTHTRKREGTWRLGRRERADTNRRPWS
jgi:hypothetical protein